MPTSTAAADIVLIGCWRSSCSHRLQIALRLKQLSFRYQPLSLDQQEQREPWFLALTPLGQVPLLLVNGETWADSLVALESLDEQFGGCGLPLLPAAPAERRQVRRLVNAIGTSLQPLLLSAQFRQHLPLDAETIASLRLQHQREGLERLQQLVHTSAGGFCVGDAPSLADVVLVAHLEAVARLGLELGRFDLLSRIHGRCQQLEAFAEAHPSRMADAPPQVGAVAPAPDRLNPIVAYKEPATELHHYLATTANAPIPGLDAVRQRTEAQFTAVASKVSAIEVCLLLRWFAAGCVNRRALEIGVFTGSSSLALLDGLGAGGTLTAIDCDPASTAVAQQIWHDLGLSPRVRFVLGDALAHLPTLPGGFGLIYVDGANWEYEAYLEACLPLLAPGGLLVFDNVLWRGKVCAPDKADRSATALARFNAGLQQRADLNSCIVSIGDGLALIQRR